MGKFDVYHVTRLRSADDIIARLDVALISWYSLVRSTHLSGGIEGEESLSNASIGKFCSRCMVSYVSIRITEFTIPQQILVHIAYAVS